jgi:superfamily II DNA or RNA helicase
MAKLEELVPGALVTGILPAEAVTIESVKWFTNMVSVTYIDSAGKPDKTVLSRDREAGLEVVTSTRKWAFTGDGALLRLVSEANRIRLAHLFDPYVAVQTSRVEPLPHQIQAVYGHLLPKQPLRFLLADDPGAGKTIMAGLYIKELLLRGDLRKCLICAPGSLVTNWQEELKDKFGLDFVIITNDLIEASSSGNPYHDHDLVISRLDHMSRNDQLKEKVKQIDWDLVVIDEAHKMSATIFGDEVKKTLRFDLGQVLGEHARNLLMMTATPHNGKDEDFQLFLSLLDSDRFEGKPRDGSRVVETSDIMRRMVKEKLVRFDGTPLFPPRLAHTISYRLSEREYDLYAAVTDYVREEMNRAERLEAEGQGRRRAVVGFALTTLQRRLASSPEAIYQSLRRRRERLEARLHDEQWLARAAQNKGDEDLNKYEAEIPADEDDQTAEEVEVAEEVVVDQASAARNAVELKHEIDTLKQLEQKALNLRNSRKDRKWEELSSLLQQHEEMRDRYGNRRKLIVFTEHRDTLNYVADQIRALLGKPEAVVVIHGSMGRDDRKKTEEAFKYDPTVQILVATDAAGEGINLQRAHLMVNYDLPWNPNRLEQRFGRIHRIGQTEVCHMWNMVAEDTREALVFQTLLHKLEQESKALGGQVFDVLGKAFQDVSLKDMLMQAIRYGDSADVAKQIKRTVEATFDHEQIQKLLSEDALAREVMTKEQITDIRERMDRAEARRLQPHFIGSFFREAFTRLGGTIKDREPGRWQITHVPARIRERDRQIGRGVPIQREYERVTFDKNTVVVEGRPLAAFVYPGHPLLDSVIDLIRQDHGGLLKEGAILVDPRDNGQEPRLLVYLEHTIQDARTDSSGQRRTASKEFHFVELLGNGNVRSAGYAPYLDYDPVPKELQEPILAQLKSTWLKADWENRVQEYALTTLAPEHYENVRRERELRVQRTTNAVKSRLMKEIAHWDYRAVELDEMEAAGRKTKLSADNARRRADALRERMSRRLAELEAEKHLNMLEPQIVGVALVVPQGLINTFAGQVAEQAAPQVIRDTKTSELAAMRAVEAREDALGFITTDRSAERNIGYDIESKPKVGEGRLRFIEVKARNPDADIVTVTRSEYLCGLNKPDQFILAIVTVDNGNAKDIRYVRKPWEGDLDFKITSVNLDLKELLAKSENPA